ncbi:MAG: hypothetical protein ACJAY8_000502 [Sphingobacteriales bacterium]|jgi:hypothetical protein
MDVLKTYLSSLDKKEQEEFRKYLSYQGKTKDRIDVHLFQTLLDHPDWGNTALIQQIYAIKDPKLVTDKIKNSYYQWRSILTGHIEDYCLQRVTQENKLLYVVKLFLLARFLFNRKKYAAAFRYVQKAEKLAKSSENYNLLEQIYALKFDYAWTQPNFQLEELLTDIRLTRERLHIENRSIEAYNILHFNLNNAKRKGEHIEHDTLLSEAKERFGDRDEIAINSKAFYKFTMAIYLVLDEKREFSKMMDHLISAFEFMEEAGMFGDHNRRVALEMVTLIMRSAVISKNFKTASKYQLKLKEIYRDFSENPLLNFRSHVVEYVFLSCTGKLEEANQKITYLNENETVQELIKEDNKAYQMLMSNLISSSFSMGNFSLSKKHLFNLINNERRVRESEGVEGVLFIYIVELIVYYKLADFPTVIKKIPPLKKRFAPYSNLESHTLYSTTIDLMGMLAKDKETPSEETKSKIREYLTAPEKMVIGTNQFLPLKPFFNSILAGTRYYDELLKEVRSEF